MTLTARGTEASSVTEAADPATLTGSMQDFRHLAGGHMIHRRDDFCRGQDSRWEHGLRPLGRSTGYARYRRAAERQRPHRASGPDWQGRPRDGLVLQYLQHLLQRAVAGPDRDCAAGVREFLVLHYRSAARNDTPYWRDAKTRVVPDALAERIEHWQVQLPDSETVYPYYHGLPPYSYMCILLDWDFDDIDAGPHLQHDSHAIADCEIRTAATPVGDHAVVFGEVVRVTQLLEYRPCSTGFASTTPGRGPETSRSFPWTLPREHLRRWP
ncbi:tryptophan 7-halogenase [Mycobacterium riyadhense]|uniref:tryptophan 7-halogenase n=1 Tax=Mycobacterium riyadhense TaxID=486698 RepID=UPI00195F165F|nr:tryptophan 7-halogenase [Mycobacterium riyadhense]